jgi:hypothetical protein
MMTKAWTIGRRILKDEAQAKRESFSFSRADFTIAGYGLSILIYVENYRLTMRGLLGKIAPTTTETG